jgi:hypothetical protein
MVMDALPPLSHFKVCSMFSSDPPYSLSSRSRITKPITSEQERFSAQLPFRAHRPRNQRRFHRRFGDSRGAELDVWFRERSYDADSQGDDSLRVRGDVVWTGALTSAIGWCFPLICILRGHAYLFVVPVTRSSVANHCHHHIRNLRLYRSRVPSSKLYTLMRNKGDGASMDVE